MPRYDYDHNLDFSVSSWQPRDDPHSPYQSTDVSKLPEWWQEAIQEFEEYDLRPYRPSRFEDGRLTHTVVEKLENDLNISISFVGWNVKYEDDWKVQIDGYSIGEIGRRRSPEGYTIFEMDSTEFVEFVKNNI